MGLRRLLVVFADGRLIRRLVGVPRAHVSHLIGFVLRVGAGLRLSAIGAGTGWQRPQRLVVIIVVKISVPVDRRRWRVIGWRHWPVGLRYRVMGTALWSGKHHSKGYSKGSLGKTGRLRRANSLRVCRRGSRDSERNA
jgi:hypothetical protein